MTVDFDISIEDTKFETVNGIHGFIGGLKEFAEYHGAKLVDVVVLVDGKPSVGTCETCGLPILPGEEYGEDSTGVMWHKGACSLDEE